jgi:hypothetical protein
LLPNELKRIRVEYRELLSEVKAVLRWIDSQRSAVSELSTMREWIYVQARRGNFRTLPLWPGFFAWFQRWNSRARFLSNAVNASHAVMEFLADAYGVKPESIRTARLSTAPSR